MFRSSHFSFFVFGHFWQWSYASTKILLNLCLYFARQDGKDRKKGEKITQLKWPKYQKPKVKIWDEQNTCIATPTRSKSFQNVLTLKFVLHNRYYTIEHGSWFMKIFVDFCAVLFAKLSMIFVLDFMIPCMKIFKMCIFLRCT